MKHRRPAAVLVALGLTLGAAALAQDTKGTAVAPPAKDAAATAADQKPDPNAPPVRTVSTRVEAIDASGRTLSFKGARGNTISVKVHRGVRNLGELAPGDAVEVRYVDAVASTLKKATPGTKPPGSPEIAARIAAAEGQGRGGPPPSQRKQGGSPSKAQGKGGQAPASSAPASPAAPATAGAEAAAAGSASSSATPAAVPPSGSAGDASGAAQNASAAEKPGDGRRGGSRGRERGGGGAAIPKVGMRGIVETIDPKEGFVVVKDSKGSFHELRIKDTSVLSGLKTGDTVDAVYSEAVAFVVSKGKPGT